MKFKKIKTTIGSFATAGYLFYLAAFTFVGAMLLTPLIGWAIAAVFFAVIVEGTVYAKNILEAVTNSDYKLVLELAIAEKDLKECDQFKVPFAKEYFELKNYLHELKENLSNYNERDRKIAEKNINSAKKCLKHMLIQFKNAKKTGADPYGLFKGISILADDTTTFNNTVQSRKKWMLGSFWISLASGVFSGLSAYSLIITNFMTSPLILGYLTKVGISTVLASTVGAPLLAGLACLGSMLVMYGSASHVVKKGNLDKWLERISILTTSVPNTFEGLAYVKQAFKTSLKKLSGYVLFPALVVFTTIAAAWSFGTPIFNLTANITLRTLTFVTWPCMFGLTLLFNTDNALKSLKQIRDEWSAKIDNLVSSWKEKETLSQKIQFVLQLLNPFLYAKDLLILCHSYCAGITTDSFPWIPVPPALTAFFGMWMEYLTDYHYGGHAHVHESHGPHDHAHTHSHEDHEDHDHGSFLDIPIDVCNHIGVVVDYVFAHFAGNFSYTFEEAKNKFLPTYSVPAFPSLSDSTVNLYYSKKLDKLERTYKEENPPENVEVTRAKKSAAFKNISTALENAPDNKKAETLVDQLDPCLVGTHVLARHRHNIWLKPPASYFEVGKLLTDPVLTQSQGYRR